MARIGLRLSRFPFKITQFPGKRVVHLKGAFTTVLIVSVATRDEMNNTLVRGRIGRITKANTRATS